MAIDSASSTSDAAIVSNEMSNAQQTGVTPAAESWSVEKALKTFNVPYYTTPPSNPIPYFHLLERLKTTKREGWRRFSISQGESISDHMYRMSILTMVVPTSLSSGLDIHRCTQMALVHDMAESLVGDITPRDGISKAEKSRREATTIGYIADTLLGGPASADKGREIKELWNEYEDDKTREATLVHDIDKLELVLQMCEYEKANAGKVLDLGEFAWVIKKIRTPDMKVWCAQALRERETFWKEKGVEVNGLDIGRELIEEVERSGFEKN